MVQVQGQDKPLPLFMTKLPDGSSKPMAQQRRIGIMATMLDPANPTAEPVRVNINDRTPINALKFEPENYTDI